MRAVILIASLTLALPLHATLHSALVPPPGFTVAAESSNKRTHDCPQAQPYTGMMDFPSKFEGSDRARDDLNKQSEKEYRERIEPISTLERGLNQQVEDYLRNRDPEALRCSLGLLHAWASADALQGEATTHTGKSMRKWALASVASSYLRLKFSASRPLASEQSRADEVEAWMGRLADRVMAEWRDLPQDKINNHEYWAAWAVMASGVALDRRNLFDWALQRLDAAAGQIDDSGYLPNELKRDTRALYYHNYALTPLTMIAAFAKANGVSVSERNRKALLRLADRVIKGVDDPAAFEKRTGKDQNVEDFEQRSKFAWMEPYCWTFQCSERLQKRLDSLRPLKSYRLGGNVTQLFRAAPDEVSRASHRNPSTLNPLENDPWTITLQPPLPRPAPSFRS
jgi:poly(beta-D-mannuronate) lyase